MLNWGQSFALCAIIAENTRLKSANIAVELYRFAGQKKYLKKAKKNLNIVKRNIHLEPKIRKTDFYKRVCNEIFNLETGNYKQRRRKRVPYKRQNHLFT